MGWNRHRLLWDGNGTNRYVPWTTLGLSMGMSFLWKSHGKRPMEWDGTGINCYGAGMGQINVSHGQPWVFRVLGPPPLRTSREEIKAWKVIGGEFTEHLLCPRHLGKGVFCPLNHKRARRGVGRPPPDLKIFRANSVFRASASCSEILNVKRISNTVKSFRAHSVFQGKRKLLKNPECKKYIQYSEFRATLFLRASTKLLKNPEWWKVYSIQWKISGQAQVAKKPWTVKKFSIQCAFTWGWSVQFGLV